VHLPEPEELSVSSYPRPHLTLAPDPYAVEEHAPAYYAPAYYTDTYAADTYAADPYAAGLYADERYADDGYAPYGYEPVASAPVVQSEYAPGDESWRQEALCAETDPEAFFPEKGGSTREAKRVCVGCPVRMQCLEYALDNDERFGIWGGLSERERRRVKLARRSEPLSA
jgi:WhiB family redox-sensing transcriptional regulator